MPSPVIARKIPTPLGPMQAAATEKGIIRLEFSGGFFREAPIPTVCRQARPFLVPAVDRLLDCLQEQLIQYFSGRRKMFDLPLAPAGTPFQQAVWQGLQDIPWGQTRSYSEQARVLGKPRAVRALARACGANPLAILVPCHRVIGRDGRLTGYAGGLERKDFLLRLEGVFPRLRTKSQAKQ